MLASFLFKFLDKFLSTSKNILLIKGKIFSSASIDALAFIVVIFVTKIMVKVSTIPEYLVLGLAVFFGNILSYYMLKKFEKDKKWLHIIQFEKRSQGKKILDKLRDEGLIVISSDSYNDNLQSTLSANIQTLDKNQARILKDLLKNVVHKEITITDIRS